MKKIIFMIINMNIGGTEKALLNMINGMSKDDFEITILMLEEYGGFLSDIPNHIKVKYFNQYANIKDDINNPPISLIKNYLKEFKIRKAINRLKYYLISKIAGERSSYFKYILRNELKIEEQYDIAIAYAGPSEFITYFLQEKISAKEKYQWIHFDVSKIAFNKKFYEKQFKKFNKVVTVSSEGKDRLLDIIPRLEDKVVVRLNDIPKKDILQKANEEKGFKDSFDGKRILTVGRLAHEKGQDLAIKACKKLIDSGENVRWYCIGDGNKKNEYMKLVEQLNLQDNFIFLGSKKNPYPYMKECDIYVQPSRHEGFCITLGEAKLFKSYIVTTNFTGAKEQLACSQKYKICACDSSNLFEGIKQVINKDNDLKVGLEIIV